MDTEELSELKRRRLALLQRKLELKKKYGLLYYKPHPKQTQFHEAAKFRFRFARTSNRFGKSEMGCAEDIAHTIGERVWYPKSHPMRTLGIKPSPTKGLIITTDWDKVDEIFTGKTGKLWTFIPRSEIKSQKKNHSGVICELEFKNGSIIRFDTHKSFMSNPLGSESSDWDWIHVDEPITEAHWKAVSRGLVDRGGKAWFTATLLSEPWINRMFVPSHDDNEKELIEQHTADGRPLKYMMTGTMYDNPYLTEEAITDFEAELTDDEKQCRIYGIPLHLSGLVYKEFEAHRHVLKQIPAGWTDYHLPPARYTYGFAIDPHPRTPNAVLFFCVDPFGNIYFYDEIYEAVSIEGLAALIRSRQEGGRHFYIKLLDPLAYIPDPVKRITSMEQELSAHGVFCLKAPKDLATGIPNARSYLRKPSGVYFAPTLKRTLYEINNYVWDDKHGVPSNKPRDEDDHMMENMYRILLQHPRYNDPDESSYNPCDEEAIESAGFEQDEFDYNFDHI